MPKKKNLGKKVADTIAAGETEIKKTVRKAKEAAEAAAQSDAAAAAEIEVKKTAKKAVRKVKAAVEPVVEETR